MRDTLEAIALLVALIIGAVVGILILCAGAAMIWNTIYAGTVVEYEGTVQTVIKNSFLAPHTEVVLRTYSEDDVHFSLNGYHDFNIGDTIKIRMTMRPYVYGLVCWGDLKEVGG